MTDFNVVKQVIGLSHTSQFGNVLDACSGNGAFSKLLINYGVSYGSLYMVDKAMDCADLISSPLKAKNVKYIKCDISNTPFDDSYFDLIVMGNAIHHLADLPAAMREIHRVLKQNGAVVFVEETTKGCNSVYEQYHQLIASMDSDNDEFHHLPYSVDHLKAELSKYFSIQHYSSFSSRRSKADCQKYARSLQNKILNSALKDNTEFFRQSCGVYHALMHTESLSIMFAFFFCKKLPS